MIDFLEHTNAIVAIGTGACGWLLAVVRKKEQRIKSVEDTLQDLDRRVRTDNKVNKMRVQEIKEDVKEIKGSVKMLVEHQLSQK